MLRIAVVLALISCTVCSVTQCPPSVSCTVGSVTQCPPSKMKIIVKSHDNGTSMWQSPIVLYEEGGNSNWKMTVDQKFIVDIKGLKTLETIIYLKAPNESPEDNEISVEKDKQQFVSPIPPPQKVVPSRYELYPGVGYYTFHHGVSAWPAARDRCAAEGGHLVIINSEAERQVVRSLFVVLNPNSPGSSQPEQIHAGLHRVGEGKYETIFGVPIEETGFSQWHVGQPSSGAREPCMSIMKESIAYNDISCSKEILAFICEIDL